MRSVYRGSKVERLSVVSVTTKELVGVKFRVVVAMPETE